MYSVSIDKNMRCRFNNFTRKCIGTGRLDLGLRKEYYEQLSKVQKDIGFSYIRGHGLFCDDMGIYQVYKEDGKEIVEYNFTYVDQLFDSYMELGIKPYVEIGFMPEKMASGDQHIFYWKGNTTPPKDKQAWSDLIKASINHWIGRYGIDEVRSWYFEVWNEPNLPGFWKDADMDAYFELYRSTAHALRACDDQLRVGGPAICGVDDERWLREFLSFCDREGLALDFVTRHAYATEEPISHGHFQYQKLRSPEIFIDELKVSRNIIDSFDAFKGLEMHLTEFNTSYTPINPIHDTNLNGAYIARLLSEIGDYCSLYSYWTFGDVFEEFGVPFSLFSGSFGLLTYGSIPKPTFWTFQFFSDLGGHGLSRGNNHIATMDEKGNVRLIVWNIVEEGDENLDIELDMKVEEEEYFLIKKTVNEEVCNPLKDWVHMGAPKSPDKADMKLLKQASSPCIRTQRMTSNQGRLKLNLCVGPNEVSYITIENRLGEYDRGFDVERIRGAK